jgi:hypothetical protein
MKREQSMKKLSVIGIAFCRDDFATLRLKSGCVLFVCATLLVLKEWGYELLEGMSFREEGEYGWMAPAYVVKGELNFNGDDPSNLSRMVGEISIER